MAGGYVHDESTFVEDGEQVTAPQELSVDSVCGSIDLPVTPAASNTSAAGDK